MQVLARAEDERTALNAHVEQLHREAKSKQAQMKKLADQVTAHKRT